MAGPTLRVVDFGSRKIHAIKFVRQLSGVGLKDAKDLVESASAFVSVVSASVLESVIDEAAGHGIRFERGGSKPARPSGGGGAFAVRYLSGARKIHAIKLARELSGFGLKEAKDAVDHQRVIKAGLSREQAEAIAARFAEFGSSVGIEADDDGGSGSSSKPPIFAPRESSPSPWLDDSDDDF